MPSILLPQGNQTVFYKHKEVAGLPSTIMMHQELPWGCYFPVSQEMPSDIRVLIHMMLLLAV